jgi:hypothetical protein
MEQHDEDGVEIKLGGWKKQSPKTGTKFISLSVDTYVKKDEAKPVTNDKDEWEI